jgi:sugar phosphate isomerase/epimerase
LALGRELGLDVPFVHLGYTGINKLWVGGKEGDILADGFINDLDVCGANGVPMVVMHLTAHSVAPPPSLIGIARLKRIVDHAEELGIKVAFENTKIPGYLEFVFNYIKNNNAGICYDSGHAHCHFDDKFDWELFKNKIFAVHLHDNNGFADQHLLPFDGTIDWTALAKNLVKANYLGPVTLESCYFGPYLNMNIDQSCSLSLSRAHEFSAMMDKEKGEMSISE